MPRRPEIPPVAKAPIGMTALRQGPDTAENTSYPPGTRGSPCQARFRTSALFLLPNAMQLHNATSTSSRRATVGM